MMYSVKTRSLFFIIFLICYSLTAKAQKIQDLISKDTLVHIFRVDNEQLDSIYKSRSIPDTSWMFKHKIDSFSYKKYHSDSLGFGNFIVAKVVGKTAYLSFFTKYPFTYSINEVKKQALFYLKNIEDGSEIVDYSVYLNNRKSDYDIGYGAFKLTTTKENKKKNNNKYIKVIAQGVAYYIELKRSKINDYSSKSSNMGSYGVQVSAGYFLTNKPKYRIYDTVKLKAFFVNSRNGKPIKKKIDLFLKGNGKTYWKKRIKPTTPGAFVYQFNVPDSLLLDKTYTLEAHYKKRGDFFERSTFFKLEDYTLKTNKFDFIIPKDTFRKGEECILYAKASDANDFPLTNARCKVKISIEKIFQLYTDTFQVSNSEMKSWYSLDTIMSDIDITEIKIPKNKLPNALIKFKVKSEIIDERLESKMFTKYFYYDAQTERILFFQFNDSLYINRLVELKEATDTFDVLLYNSNTQLDSFRITTPNSMQLPPNCTSAQLVPLNKVNVQTLKVTIGLKSLLTLKAIRTFDSIKVSFDFPFSIPVHYKLYRGKELVDEGQTNTYKYEKKDESTTSYELLVTANTNSSIEKNYIRYIFRNNKRKLRIKANMPKEVFAGDKVSLDVNVLDNNKEPLSGVNLTLFGVSAMFDDQLPEIDFYFPFSMKENLEIKPLKKNTYNYNLKELSVESNVNIRSWMLERFNLYKNEYYQIHYATKDITKFKLPLSDGKTQVAIVVLNQKKLIKPTYTNFNDTLSYHNNLQHALPYAQNVRPGMHNVTMRFFEKIYSFKNLTVSKGFKNIFVIQLDSILKDKKQSYVLKDSLPIYKMSPKEFLSFDQRSLALSNFGFDTLVVYGQLHEEEKTYFFSRYELGDVNMRDEQFDALPIPRNLQENEAIILEANGNKYSINKKPKTTYFFYDDIFKEKQAKLKEETSFSFTSTNIDYPDLLDTVNSIKPIEMPKSEKKVVKQTYSFNVSNNIEADYESPLGAYVPSGFKEDFIYFHIQDTLQKGLVGLWLVNHNYPKKSTFVKMNYYNKGLITHQGGPGTYDIYYLFANNTMTVHTNQQLKVNNNWYVNTHFLKKKEINENEIQNITYLFNGLTQKPTIPFLNYPNEEELEVSIVHKAQRSISLIRGLLKNNYGQELSNIDLYLEKSGRFYAGATTNEFGKFEFLNVPKGEYMIKVYDPQYQARYAYNVNINKVAEYFYTISLTNNSFINPILLINNNDVRLEVYSPKFDKINSSAIILDKETRAPITNCKIYIIKDSSSRYLFTQTNRLGQFKLYNASILDSSYTMEFQCKGYKKLMLTNMMLDNNNRNVIKVFLQTKGQKDSLPTIVNMQLNAEINQIDVSDKRKVKLANASSPKFIQDNNIQGNYGIMSGKVKAENGSPLSYAAVKVVRNGKVVGGKYTDDNGNFKIARLAPGVYDLVVTYVGYKKNIFSNIQIRLGSNTQCNISMIKSSQSLKSVRIVSKRRLIDNSAPAGQEISGKEIRQSGLIEVGAQATTMAGVNGTRESNSVSIGGDRSSGTTYMIDGMLVTGTRATTINPRLISNVSVMRTGVSAKYGDASGGIYDFSNTAIESYAAPTNSNLFRASTAKSIRSNFSDVAFWEPNVLTDEKGNAHVTLQFPDNITQWKTYIIAMTNGFKHNVLKQNVRSYKPIMVNSILPRFMYKGDTLEAKVKFRSFDNKQHNMRIGVKENEKQILSKKVFLDNSYLDSVLLKPVLGDSLIWQADLDIDTYYKDGERMAIPLFKSGLQTTDFKLQALNKDSTYNINLGNNRSSTLIFNNQLIENILLEIDKLSKYPYACNEQKASKIRGYLIEKKIRKRLNQDFAHNKELKQLIRKLERAQAANGSWSWWNKGDADHRMTIYITEVMFEASQSGYTNAVSEYGKTYLKKNIMKFSVPDKLYALYVLKRMQSKVDYDKIVKGIEYENLDVTSQLYFVQNELQYKKDLNISRVYDCINQLKTRKTSYSSNFFYDPLATISLSTRLLEGTHLYKDILTSVKPLLSRPNYISRTNTFSKIYLIEAWMRYLETKSNTLAASMKIDEGTLQNTFPIRFKTTNENVLVTHSGADVWLSILQDIYIPNPQKIDTLFDIRTSFMQNDTVIKNFKKGQEINYVVDIMSFRTQEHIMIEVPIPSACNYIRKDLPAYGINHIEYKRDKAIYYIDKKSVGNTRITIPLRINFAGSFVLPPVKAALMYYPHKMGNTEKRTILVE